MKSIVVMATLLLTLPCGATSPFPICGVLTQKGYRVPEAKAQFKDRVVNAVFVVPTSLRSPIVKRYQVVDNHHLPGFLEAHVNWWVCVIKGKLIKEAGSPPKINYSEVEYGILQIDDFSVDMSNGERGWSELSPLTLPHRMFPLLMEHVLVF